MRLNEKINSQEETIPGEQSVTLENIFQLPPWDVVLTIFSDERPLSGVAGLFDWALSGDLSSYIKNDFFTGAKGESLLTVGWSFEPQRRIFLLGLGSAKRCGAKTIKDLCQQLWPNLQKAGSTKVFISIPHSRYREEVSELFKDNIIDPPAELTISYLKN